MMNEWTGLATASAEARTRFVETFIMHHVSNSQVLNLPFGPYMLPPWLSLHGVTLLVSAVVLLALMAWVAGNPQPVRSGFANGIEALVVFVRDQIAIKHLGEEDGRRLTPLLLSLFFFILMMNLVGLIPGMSTPTANINVTGALAVVTFMFMVGGAVWKHGLVGFFRGFVPSGIPWPVLIMLVPIEFISMFIKVFALMIRLFANELAGHMVVFSLLGLLIIYGMWALPAMGLAVLIYALEVGVAFLQAYIFVLLSAVFIGQRYHPEH